MRPGRTILLVGEGDLSDLRFCLSHSKANYTQGCYEVSTAKSIVEAIDLLKLYEFDLLICHLPLAGADTLLEVVKEKKMGARMTMVIRQKATDREGEMADCRLVRPARWEILENIKVFTIRKRGPARGWQLRREQLCGK